MNQSRPKKMKAIVLHQYENGIHHLRLEDRPILELGPSDVLIQIQAASINPSDLMFIQGLYGFRKPLPVVPGFEGCGKVVAAGSSLMARFLLGRRVACTAPQGGDGTWAEFLKAPALSCLPLSSSIDDDQGAMMIVNPFTALALVERAHQEKAKAFVQTAAGSQLGRMIWALGKEKGMTVIGIVRRQEQQQELLRSGMENVLWSGSQDFEHELAALCQRFGARLAFDAVAGKMTSILMKCLPDKSRVIVYGGLALEQPEVSVHSLIFEGKKLEGFWLTDWVADKGLFSLLQSGRQVLKRAKTELRSEVRARYPLEKYQEALQTYSNHMSGGKVLFQPFP